MLLQQHGCEARANRSQVVAACVGLDDPQDEVELPRLAVRWKLAEGVRVLSKCVDAFQILCRRRSREGDTELKRVARVLPRRPLKLLFDVEHGERMAGFCETNFTPHA